MPIEDVEKALAAMDDDDAVLGRVASGDLSDLSGLDLDEHDKAVVQEAAENFPEVEGYVFTYGAKGTSAVFSKSGKISVAKSSWQGSILNPDGSLSQPSQRTASTQPFGGLNTGASS